MMKKTLKLMGLCALAMLALAGCKKDEPNSGKTTVKATISQPNGNAKTGVGAGNMLVWNSGDRIKVYSDDRNEVAEFTTNANNVTEATFSSQTEMDVTDGFYAFYPADDVTYTGGNFVLTLNAQQNGVRNTFGSDTYPMYATYASDKFTFHSPCALLAVAMNGTATIGSIVLTGAPDEKLNGTYTFNPSDMANSTLSDTGSNTITLSFGQSGLQLQSAVNDTVYFALPAGKLANGFTVVFKGLDGSDLFTKTASANTINTTAAETILRMPAVEVNAAPAFDPLNTPLTFEARTAGVNVEFGNGSGTADLQYSTDGGENWNTYTSAITLVNAGDVVLFRGTNSTLNDNHFSCSGQCYIYGNVMSLLDNNYPSATSVGASALVGLFAFAPIDIPSDKELLLPATTLAQECYIGMFYGCTSLTKAPALPATTLAQGCYYFMFYGCTSLTTAPVLSATTLAEGCYYEMFEGCTSLTTAPVLPATTLAGSCYSGMFYGCTSLATAPVLPATTLAKTCYSAMFYGCTNLTTAPALQATTLAESCYSSMFEGCTNLTTAPDLPATTLAEWCYNKMFKGCTSLNSITCLATSGFDSSGCTDSWVNGVAPTGTFTADPTATWSTGISGIPSSWMRKNPDGSDYEPTFDPLTTPLTFEAREDNVNIGVNNASSISLEYNLNGSGWTPYTDDITLAHAGDIVQFRGNNTDFQYHAFTCSDSCYIYGNVMSLLHAGDYATNNSLSEYAFTELFYYNENIDIHPEKDLVLPATTLAPNCYNGMFEGSGLTKAPALPATTLAEKCYASMFFSCTGLQTAPALPATTLAYRCYDDMFRGCSHLTTAPALPATTLAEECYASMFSACTSLQTAPELPATTLASACYDSMFEGCASLTTAPTLPAETLAPNCYHYMFMQCTSLTTAPDLPATTLVDHCYREMFYGCTNLTTAPTLPAPTLVNQCYYYMFYGCSHLNSITCLATSGISENSSTSSWVYGVSSTGTFTKVSGVTSWPTGSYGIPSGWTVVSVP